MADRAGVSAATASRSLRGLAKVSPETRQRVIDAARELSYTAALPAAPEFAPGPRKTVAIIVPFITRWFFTTVTAAAVDHLRENGYDVLLYHLGNADVRDDFFSRMPLAGRVDGILVLSAPLNEEHTLALRALTIPCVTVGTIVPGAPAVGFDAVAAARHAVNHLIHLRHRRIGMILGEADDPRFEFETSAQRRQGCEEALHSAGLSLPESLVATGPHGPDGGAQAMTELLSRHEARANRVTAMASMFDLTTVAQDVERQGSIAAELLLRAVGGQAFSPAEMQVLVPTRLMLRGTTAPPATPSDRRTGTRRRA